LQEEEEDKKLAEILKVHQNNQVMQSPGPESLSCEYDVLSAKSLLSNIIRAVKGNFGFSVRKLRYESLPDETEEEALSVSYTSHLLDLLVSSPLPLASKVDTVMARLQARLGQSLKSDSIIIRRPGPRRVCLRCGHVSPVTCQESVLEPRDPESWPDTCDACDGSPAQHHHAAPVHGEEQIYPRNS